MAFRRKRGSAVVTLVAVFGVVLGAGCGADPGAARRPNADAVSDSVISADDFTGGIDPVEAVDQRGSATVKVVVTDNAFTDRAITIDVGTQVSFVNQGQNPHNVLPSNEGQFPEIPTGSLDPQAIATRTFDRPGTYPYHCSIHGTRNKGQRGLIVVR